MKLGRSAVTGEPIWFLAQAMGSTLRGAIHTPTFEIYVAASGSDQNPGSIDRPIASLSRAQELVRARKPYGQPVITGKNSDGKLTLTGGWQNNRPRTSQTDFVGDVPGIHHDYRFVENIFEELDAPGEWYLDHKSHILCFYPPEGLNLNQTKVEIVSLKDLIEFRGTQRFSR